MFLDTPQPDTAFPESAMPDIMHLVPLSAPPSVAYHALTTSEGVRAWWTADADLDSGVGGAGEFRFYGGQKVTRVLIEELSPPHQVAWTVLESFRPEWVGTKIVFELRAVADGSQLLFAQRGYPVADDAYALCTTGWGIYFTRLQEYLETGQIMTD